MRKNDSAIRLVIGALGCLATLVVAAKAPAIGQFAPPDRTRFEVVAESGKPEIPFERINNHVVVPLSINGSKEFQLVLDTGMPASGVVLYGDERIEALDLDYAPIQAQVGGAGGEGQTIQAQIALEEELRLPGLEMHDARVMVLDTPEGFGDYHDGIVGYSLFQRWVVEIDNDESVIRLHESEGFEPPQGAHELPLTLRGNMPFVEVDVAVESGERFPAEVVVDLGAAHVLSLNTDESEQIVIPDGAIEARLGHGLSGPIDGKIGRVAEVDLGGYVLKQVVTSFPVREHQDPRGLDSLAGNLGNGALQRFTTIFDYANERMLLVPGDEADEPFVWDQSGIEFAFGSDDLRVERVLPGSPAARAGLKADDIV